MSDPKYKIVTISDHILAPSGVGLQTKYIVDNLVSGDDFKIISIAGAIKHQDYKPQRFDKWGDKVTIFPVDGYGSKNLIRQIIDVEKPDAIWFITDPRFYGWLWEMEDEVHQQCPLLYWHVWDNYPYPKYNESFYKSTDFIGCINKLTFDFLDKNGFENIEYIPHAVPEEDFKIFKYDEISDYRKTHINSDMDKFVVFYNSRNALRKRTGNVIAAFKEFVNMLPKDEQDNAFMCMHTPPRDREGQNLFDVIKALDIEGNVGFHDKKVENKIMAEFYNMADVTISLSSEEGFGLSILESLMCGTPVICTKTGGMQDQVIDDELSRTFGHCLEPDARSLVGSQSTPYIWSDHVDPMTAAHALLDLYKKKKELGPTYKDTIAGFDARESMLRKFNMEKMQTAWKDAIINQIELFRERKTSRPPIKMVAI